MIAEFDHDLAGAAEHGKTGQPARRFRDFSYVTSGSGAVRDA